MGIALEDYASFALFAHVVESRSFTAAAAKLGISKSAVSKRLAELEDQLSVKLLHRTTRRLSLTDDGRRFYEHCAALASCAQQAKESVLDASQKVSGVVRVNAPRALGSELLARLIGGFAAAHPEVTIELTTEDRFVDLVGEGYDLVLGIRTKMRKSSLVARSLATGRLLPCAAPSYLARAGVPETPDDLLEHNCLRYGLVSVAADWTFRGADGAFSVPVHGNFETTDGSVLLGAALAGLGIAMIPTFVAGPHIAADRLRVVLDSFAHTKLTLYAMFADRRNLPIRTRALVDFLVKNVPSIVS